MPSGEVDLQIVPGQWSGLAGRQRRGGPPVTRADVALGAMSVRAVQETAFLPSRSSRPRQLVLDQEVATRIGSAAGGAGLRRRSESVGDAAERSRGEGVFGTQGTICPLPVTLASLSIDGHPSLSANLAGTSCWHTC